MTSPPLSGTAADRDLPAQASDKILAIQALRAYAALGVTLFHITVNLKVHWGLDRLPQFTVGAAGVDLFFAISGFVMVHAAAPLFARTSGSRIFMRRRLARVVPLYWAATLLMALAIPVYSMTEVAASLLFVPFVKRSGEMGPIHPLGWTLNYEMLFYVIFAAAMVWPLRRAVPAATAALAALVLAGAVVRPESALLRFWTDPIVLEFAFGMWIAVAYRAGLRVPAGAAAALVVAGCGLALLYSPEASPALRALFWGVPMAMVLAGAVLSRRADGLATRLLARLGDASYSLYLLHFIVLLAWSRLWLAAGWDAARAPLLYAGAVLVIAVAVSLLAFRCFELPVTRSLRTA
jgi:exopolysaccharide production protein ExoZ